MNQLVANLFQEHMDVVNDIREVNVDEISFIAKAIIQKLNAGSTIFWCGNGGSAADSQHFAAELVGRFKVDRPAIRSIALTTDASVLTCVGNDFGFENIFCRQLEALARPGDALIALSTSGNSENIIKVLKKAALMNVDSIALLGNDGGKAKLFSDKALIVNSYSTARIQEAHGLICHILCELIEKELFCD